ncbi:MAG TPA: vWA domain-containing protein, partial [Myxococcota bacterium]
TPFRLFPGATTPITVTPRRAAAGVSSATVVVDTALGLTATLALSLDVTAVSTIEERFTAGDAISAVDILFVIDNSGSMSDDQQLLAENFAAFFAEALGSGGVDFQVGVTTTDILTPSAANGALVGAPAILRNTTPDLEGAFGRNVLVGVDGAGLELGLEAMRRAIDHPANSGFIRNNAALSVVFVTDEEDGGAFVADEGLPSLARAPDEYVALLRSTKAGALSNAPVLVSGVITPGQALRYQAVVDAFHGSVLDITRADWGSRLGEIGVDTFALARTFDLQTRTTRASITVTIDGVATTAFSYDTARGAVILDENPPTGAAIVISYQAGC